MSAKSFTFIGSKSATVSGRSFSMRHVSVVPERPVPVSRMSLAAAI